MRKLLSLVLIALATGTVSAQGIAAAQKTFWDDPLSDPMFPVYVAMVFVLLVIVMVGLVAIYLIRIINMLAGDAEKERAERMGIPLVPRPSWWSTFLERVSAAVPVEQEKTIVLDHNYDGIKELDNHLPPWWTWLFIGTIGWAVVYIFVFHFSNSLPLQEQEYQNELADAAESARILKASQPQVEVDENTLVYADDAEVLSQGKMVFLNNSCGSCHRPDGGGNTIGPNLTDAYWLHGGDVKEIFHTIKNGVVEKGMPAWGKAMSPQSVKAVTFYVMSLQGTHPVDAKAPQGELFKPVPASDTTQVEAAL